MDGYNSHQSWDPRRVRTLNQVPKLPKMVPQSHSSRTPEVPLTHSGPIHSPVPGRTDHLPMHVPPGSYVIPADIISGMGEGNTMAGFKVAKSIFSQPFYGGAKPGSGTPYGGSGTPYGQPMPGKASGGSMNGQSSVPIIAAGGEHVISPEDCAYLGGGSLEDGHKVLDEFVKRYRHKLIKTLQKLPGPKKD